MSSRQVNRSFSSNLQTTERRSRMSSKSAISSRDIFRMVMLFCSTDSLHFIEFQSWHIGLASCPIELSDSMNACAHHTMPISMVMR
jgi:hypothetical protein